MDLLVLCIVYLTVFVNCLMKQFAICLVGVVILLLNVMEVFIVDGGALLDIPVYGLPTNVRVVPVIPVWCVSRCSFICFVFVFICRKLSSHLRV